MIAFCKIATKKFRNKIEFGIILIIFGVKIVNFGTFAKKVIIFPIKA